MVSITEFLNRNCVSQRAPVITGAFGLQGLYRQKTPFTKTLLIFDWRGFPAATSFPSAFSFCKEGIQELGDFEGRKDRSHGPALLDWINGFGANTQFVAFAEVLRPCSAASSTVA